MKIAEEFQTGHTKFTNATVHGPSPTHYISQVMWTIHVNIFIIDILLKTCQPRKHVGQSKKREEICHTRAIVALNTVLLK